MLLNDIQLHVERQGDGPPLLVLHGFTGSAAEWAGQLQALCPLRTLVAVDLVGHGRSSAPAQASRYAMERCVADLLALLDALAIARCDLLGYSMGGRVALHLAAAAPERVSRMLLESASPGLADPAERAVRAAADDALADRIEAEGLTWFVDHWATLPLFASQSKLAPETRAELRARRLRGTPRGYANSLRGMGIGRQTSLWDRLPDLHTPTLLISGELDVKFQAINAQMAALLPKATHVSVPDAGHTVHLEQPEAFNELVVRFLSVECIGG
jgi:2-succinyl-6-hydroxy-2,4-cyclohexadiene-1-carboxylate synthase